jgi:hypothetical protein
MFASWQGWTCAIEGDHPGFSHPVQVHRVPKRKPI